MSENDLFLEYEKCKAENTELVRQVLALENYIEHILIPTNKITNHILIEPINEYLKKGLNESFKLTDSLNIKLQQSQNEIDKYQDKVYHSTRLIEQLEHEIELLRKVIQLQREGLEYYAATSHWVGVYHADYGELSALLNENDYDFIKVDDNDQYYAGGKRARQALAQVDELLKGEKCIF